MHYGWVLGVAMMKVAFDKKGGGLFLIYSCQCVTALLIINLVQSNHRNIWQKLKPTSTNYITFILKIERILLGKILSTHMKLRNFELCSKSLGVVSLGHACLCEWN